MNYITTVLQFLEKYDIIVLPAAAVLLTLFAVVNLAANVYRRQNKKIVAVTNKIASYPNKAAQFASALPQEYKRQWRAYVNSFCRSADGEKRGLRRSADGLPTRLRATSARRRGGTIWRDFAPRGRARANTV